jgi:DNA-binding transcriptional ArsR family regulator/predicted enzyme related to lactoylglutathione lyase
MSVDVESRVFLALADPIRRQLLGRLAAGPKPVHALAQDVTVSRSAISQHLGVLRAAGLVDAHRRGREVIYARRDQGLLAAAEWVVRYQSLQLRRALEPSREVLLHVSNITVPVVDQDRALEFYEQRLGFTVVNDRTVDGFRWISVLPEGGPCAIGLLRAPAGGVWTGISLITPDLDELHRRWRERGVQFDGPPSTQPWGARTATFADIDRNRFQLVEVPRAGASGAGTTPKEGI